MRTSFLKQALESIKTNAPSLEEVADGKVNKEIEHVYYGRLVNFDDLKKAENFEQQEQWELKIPKSEKNAGKGTIRIRKTIKGDSLPEYVLTTKTTANADGDRFEISIPTTEQNFVQFKILSDSGMKKDRYFFPAPGTDLTWEFDVFIIKTDEDGKNHYSPWIKIDLEVSSREATIPNLPIEITDLIVSPFGERTEAEEKKVTELYENIFRIKNTYLGKK
jgi:hypothetical protein